MNRPIQKNKQDERINNERKRLTEKARSDSSSPPILSLPSSPQKDGPILTPAEIITNNDFDADEKKRQLLRSRGQKGGLKTGKIKTKYKEEFVDIAFSLAAIGVTEKDIAILFRVSHPTFRGWKRAHRPFFLALKEGDAQKRSSLQQMMFNSAASGIFQMQMFLAKNWLGMTDRQDIRSTGEQTIIYKSHIPREDGKPDIDQGSKKRSTKKLQDREE